MHITGYTIESQIGQGGMAKVYRAIQESLGRVVALKVMNPFFADDPELSERFLHEGRLLASLRHANLMTIYDIGVNDEVHYISMEYVDGGDLRQRIREGIKPATALDYVHTIGSCLTAAHDAQIVHRDVKPANVLFRTDGTLLLTDFGIAKCLTNQAGLTATGSLVGSPHYLSPEQARGGAIDGRADIYSLGIVLYEMLVGEKPFTGDSEINIAMQHLEAELPRLPQHLAHCQALLDRMTAKQPEQRFSDTTSLLLAVQHLRETGQWQETETPIAPSTTSSAYEDTMVMEPTVILDTQHTGNPVVAEHPAPPQAWKPRSVFAWVTWKRAAAVGVCVLTLGITTRALVGSKDAGMPPTATSSTPSEIDTLLLRAQQALIDLRLTSPDGDNAYHYYKKVLALDPQNGLATKGFSLIADRYLALANQAFTKGQDTKAKQYVTWGLLVKDDHPELLAFQAKLTQRDGKLAGSVDRLFRSVNGIFK